MDKEEIKEILIKIENERKIINQTIDLLSEDEIKMRISEILKIDNGDFYLNYLNLLKNKLTT